MSVNNSTWRVRWEAEGLVGPDGQIISPMQERNPHLNALHALDRWVNELDLLNRVPMIEGHSLWWRVRYYSANQLCHLLPYVAILGEIGRKHSTSIKTVLLENPPNAWWVWLFRSVLPNADVQSQKLHAKLGNNRYNFWMCRIKRAMATVRRISRICSDLPPSNRVLFLSHERLWNGLRDVQLDTVIETSRHLGINPIFMATVFLNVKQGERSLATRPTDTLFMDYILFRHLLTKGIPRKPRYSLNGLQFRYDNVDITPLIQAMFQFCIDDRYSEHKVMVDTAPKLFKKLGVKALVMIDENGGNHPIKCASILSGIPVVGIQHGTVYTGHPAYTYPPEVDSQSIPLCDRTCVYGDFYFRKLTENNIFSPSSVCVTGQVQMDQRTALMKRRFAERSEAAEKLRQSILPPECDRLLLLSSQSSTSPTAITHLVSNLIFRAFETCHKRNFLLIRPHPAEPNPAIFWSDMARGFDIEGRWALQDKGTLDDCLDACDIHLSASSTVLTEAAAFGRGNIILSERLFGDLEELKQAGVATYLDDYDSLDDAVDDWMLLDEQRLQQRELTRRQFIRDRFYNIDGKVGERIANVIYDNIK